MKKIKKAVLPVAGFGTRFLPATKAIPKEMLPIIDKPLVQYAVEEAIAVGIEEIIFITSPLKFSIEKHFEKSTTLEKILKNTSKTDLIDKLNPNAFDKIKFTYINQEVQKGLGHAILLSEDVIKDEPFAILLPDDLFFSKVSCLSQLLNIYSKTGDSVLAVNKVDSQNIHKYGVINPGNFNEDHIVVNDIVEKPTYENAPSDIAVCGRYILNCEIFKTLKEVNPDQSSEIQLTDAIKLMLKTENVLACLYEGEKFDCGSKRGFVKATISLSLRDAEIKNDIKNYLNKKDFWIRF